MLLKFLIFVILLPLVYANGWVDANKFYSSNNLQGLGTLAKKYPQDEIINYLNAKANLNQDNSNYAKTFILNFPSSYLSIETKKQLLNYYYANDMYDSYVKLYKSIANKYLNLNDKCSYNIATFKLSRQFSYDISSLLNNNLSRCQDFISLLALNNKLSKTQFKLFLLNLLINNQLAAFNNIVQKSTLGINSLSYNYNKILEIIALTKKDPKIAYNRFKSFTFFDQELTDYLQNYIAMQFARSQQFETAYNLFTAKIKDDSMLQWKARTALALNYWRSLIHIINQMPIKLKTSKQWIYWKAIAYKNLGQSNKSILLLNSIKDDYSYYGLLSEATIKGRNKITILKFFPSQLKDAFYKRVNMIIALHQIAIRYQSNDLALIADRYWDFLINKANDKQLLLMVKLARKHRWYDKSISAAIAMSKPYINLTHPLYFKDIYARYTKDISLALAITRQESRFNYYALSSAGAIGLMQITPSTAELVAKQLHTNNCYTRPSCNIQFGSWYINYLNSKLNNHIYALIAYNAGLNRAIRWQKSLSKLGIKQQIELIPFLETREYLKKVLVNNAIYDIQLGNIKRLNFNNYLNDYRKPFLNKVAAI